MFTAVGTLPKADDSYRAFAEYIYIYVQYSAPGWRVVRDDKPTTQETYGFFEEWYTPSYYRLRPTTDYNIEIKHTL